jgi:hypothetical protein
MNPSGRIVSVRRYVICARKYIHFGRESQGDAFRRSGLLLAGKVLDDSIEHALWE